MPTELPSGLPETVDATEDLARFLTQSGHYSGRTVKPGAFLPSPKDRATSVSRHGSEPIETLYQLGLAAAGNRALHGAAIIKCGAVRDAGLGVDADEPPARHALIRGWPWFENDKQLEKAQQKEKALQLVATTELVLFRT
ncbi:hypothetical protein [Aerosticca soli]|jgi:hypothetical protein|uniref:hypothetical protein n=1 Tax=Aerosticca soli TaxID=2010829 RepID=UPI000F82F004|nr:hypothetical protein [Aerosticca soli]